MIVSGRMMRGSQNLDLNLDQEGELKVLQVWHCLPTSPAPCESLNTFYSLIARGRVEY